jgi:tetratricopeptide (TPR) repeat protein
MNERSANSPRRSLAGAGTRDTEKRRKGIRFFYSPPCLRVSVVSSPLFLATDLITFFFLAGCHSNSRAAQLAPTPPEVARLVEVAARDRAAGDALKARAALTEALRLRPDDPKALVALGRLQLLDLSDPDAALATCRRAVAVAPADPEARYALGQQLHFQGQMEAAGAEFREALRLRPGWSHAAAWLGTTELEALHADVPAATRHLEAAVAADPRYAYARYQLGRAYGRAGRWKEAAASLEAAVTLNPGYREAHYALGQALEHLGRRDAARVALERFYRLDVVRRERRSRDVRRHAGALDPS